MLSLVLRALQLTALRSAGLSRTRAPRAMVRKEEDLDPAASASASGSCSGAAEPCRAWGAARQQRRREPRVYLYRKRRRALPTSHPSCTSTAGDGLNPVPTGRQGPGQSGLPALAALDRTSLVHLGLLPQGSTAGCPAAAPSVLHPAQTGTCHLLALSACCFSALCPPRVPLSPSFPAF